MNFDNNSWFYCDNIGQLQVGIRSIMEMKDMLVDEYGIPVCNICEEPCIKPNRCGNNTCDKIFHKQCISTYFFKNRGANNCPFCRNPWSGLNYNNTTSMTSDDVNEI